MRSKVPTTWVAFGAIGIAAVLSAGAYYAGGENARAGGAETGTQSPDTVVAPSEAKCGGGRTRTYYIAADEIAWDYAPSGQNDITGAPFSEAESIFVEQGPDRIGSVYLKALYREYTDETFDHLQPRDAAWQHLGLLGPVVRAEVGDTIRIVFKNNARFPFSLHAHGMFYLKDAEGAPYNDTTAGRAKADDLIAPGGTFTYVWSVPERAGPGPGDPDSILWMYHSHVDESGDTNAGLIGPIVVTRCGKALPDGSPRGVDREFVTLFTVFDENRSPYLGENIANFSEDPESIDPDSPEFVESNLLHAINGYVFGNAPLESMRMRVGETVRWYVLGMGSERDLHTPHWHAQTITYLGTRSDIVEILPASMKTVDMRPDNPGVWLYHCHVNDHLDAGMVTRFDVVASP